MVPEFKKKTTVSYLSTHTSYIFLCFSSFRNLWIVFSSFILAICHHVLNHIVSKTLDKYWVRCKREVKTLFVFPENRDIIKLTINLIILMIPFFKKIVRNSLTFPIDHTVEWCWPFWSSTFTFVLCHIHGRIWNISTPFFDTETLFQTNKIVDNTNERYGSVYW